MSLRDDFPENMSLDKILSGKKKSTSFYLLEQNLARIISPLATVNLDCGASVAHSGKSGPPSV